MNTVIQQLMDRKSIRVYEDREISQEDQMTILKAAAAAPSAGNQQLYTILRITDPALREKLAETCDHQHFIAEGAMVLIFLADCQKWYDSYVVVGCGEGNPRKPGAGDLLLAVEDACIAAQNAVTAAESLGIGSCYIGDIMEHEELHRELLKLPNYVYPACMLVFGYPTEKQKARIKPERIDMKYLVRDNTYESLTEEELRDMMSPKAGEKGFDQLVSFVYNKKYNSDFCKEMTRSAEEYLKKFRR